MSQHLVNQVKESRKELTSFFYKVCEYHCTDAVILELMAHRKYTSQSMFDTLKALGVFKVEYLSDITSFVPDVTDDQLKLWGLIDSKGNYILTGRYVVPIKDIAGNVIALVGWHPKGGSRKYVTTPTFGFSRDTSFFHLDSYKLSWEKFNGTVYLVEGIFDTISLVSLGLPAIGNQGLEMSSFKSKMLSRFSKVVAIPDNDLAGKSVNPLTNSFSGKDEKFIWSIETDNVFVNLPQGVKDIDDFVANYDCYDDLVACQKSKYIKKLKIED